MNKIYMAVTVLALTAAVGLLMTQERGAAGVASKAYTVEWQVFEEDAAGNRTPLYDETRYLSLSGNWRSVKRFPGGDERVLVGDLKRRAVFFVGKDKLHFISPHEGRQDLTNEQLLQSPQVVGTARVLGYEAVVLRNGGSTFYRAGALGGLVIKLEVQDEGAATKTVMEPLRIELGEPDPARLHYPSRLPVDHAFSEDKSKN